jgi:transcriptional regulator with XRE-family HTH domain
MNEVDCKSVLAKNIAYYRKALNLKQSELGARLNYSDKAVSKWERGEAMPDVVVLNQMAKFFGITLDKLCSEHEHTLKAPKIIQRRERSFTFLKNRLLVSLMSVGLLWFIATMIFVFGKMSLPNLDYLWMVFIYAIPCTMVLLIIFNGIWGKRIYTFILVSVLVWTVLLCLYLSIPLDRSELIFWLAVPAQGIILLWSFITKR